MTCTRAANAAALPANRRAFLGNSLALATAIAASATPSAAAVDPDAELVALGRQWAELRREGEAMDQRILEMTQAEIEARGEQVDAEGMAFAAREGTLFRAIEALPAAGFAGLAVKARVADFEARLDSEHIAPGTAPDRALASLVADAERLAGLQHPLPPISAAATPAGADAELLALREPFFATHSAFEAACKAHSPLEDAAIMRRTGELPPDPKADRRCEAAERLMERRSAANRKVVDRMIAIPARTVEGVAFKALVSHEHEGDLYPELVDAVMEDLIVMGGLAT